MTLQCVRHEDQAYFMASVTPLEIMMTIFLVVFALLSEFAKTRPPNAYESLVASVTQA